MDLKRLAFKLRSGQWRGYKGHFEPGSPEDEEPVNDECPECKAALHKPYTECEECGWKADTREPDPAPEEEDRSFEIRAREFGGRDYP